MKKTFLSRQDDNFNVWIESSLQWSRRQNRKTIELLKEQFCLMCMLLQPIRWRCIVCVIHHERDVREEQ